jgi:hypothetical protein
MRRTGLPAATCAHLLLLFIASRTLAIDSELQLLPARVAENDRIVLATCMTARSRFVEKYGNTLFTFYRFDGVRALKGRGGSFELRIVGGAVGDIEDSIDDLPAKLFVPGKHYLLFLGADNADGYPVLDLDAQYELTRAASPTAKRFVVPVTSPWSAPEPLDPLLARIHSLLSGEK